LKFKQTEKAINKALFTVTQHAAVPYVANVQIGEVKKT